MSPPGQILRRAAMVCARTTILRVVDVLLASQTKLHSFKVIQEAEIIKTGLPMRIRSPRRGARVREVEQASNRIGLLVVVQPEIILGVEKG
jgi:hypothetical protein